MAKTSLEHWGILAAVIDEGGFARAAVDISKASALARLKIHTTCGV